MKKLILKIYGFFATCKLCASSTKLCAKSLPFILLALTLILTGCGAISSKSVYGEASDTQSAATLPVNIYDSQDTAQVTAKDSENATIQLQNLTNGRRYTLNYNGTTSFTDQYGKQISAALLEPGCVVDVRFYKETKHLSYIQIVPESIHRTGVDRFSIDMDKGKLTIVDETFDISSHVLAFSGEKEIALTDISDMDVLSVWVYNNLIYGINIEKGHAYLSLDNDEYFLDGWIEVGNKIIRKITEDMLITVPEGTTTITISQNATKATQEVTFNRDDELVWDLADVEIVLPKTGNIIFTITPSNAKVTVDGEKVDVSTPVELEYGVHQLIVVADGYDTVSRYIRVYEPSANISVEMEETDDSDEEDEEDTEDEEDESEEESQATAEDTEESSQDSESADTESQSQVQTQTSTKTYTVNINEPQGVEVYLDGNYIGIAPCSFSEQVGNFVVTLRKTGYQTRSYTLELDGSSDEVNYSFSQLIELDDE